MKTNINKEIKNKRKNNMKKILGSSLALLVMLTGVGVTSAMMNHEEPSVEDVVKGEGIKLRPVKKVDNADGSVTQTITYEIQPANATDKTVNIEIWDADGNVVTSTDIIEVKTSVKSDGTGEIAVTIKQAFDKKLNVHVRSNYDSDIYATIAIDYEKKLLDINNGEIDDATLTNSYVMSLDKFFNADYSKFTLDKTYTYTISDIEVVYTGDNIESVCGLFMPGEDSYFVNLIKANIGDHSAITDEELWNMFDELDVQFSLADWENYLYTSTDSLDFDLDYKITCNETGLSASISTAVILDLNRQYEGCVVGVNGLELETNGLVF